MTGTEAVPTVAGRLSSDASNCFVFNFYMTRF
jgi:hypothetical protein